MARCFDCGKSFSDEDICRREINMIQWVILCPKCNEARAIHERAQWKRLFVVIAALITLVVVIIIINVIGQQLDIRL